MEERPLDSQVCADSGHDFQNDEEEANHVVQLPLVSGDALQWACTVLENEFRPKGKVDFDGISKSAGLHRKDCEIHLQAAAAVALQNQILVRDNLCKWVIEQSKAGAMIPVLYMEHVSYDETPMRLNVHWGEQKEVATTKVLVVEHEYLMLMQLRHGLAHLEDKDLTGTNATPSQFFCVYGRFSPSLRALDSCTGEGLQATLETTFQAPREAESFHRKLRLAEVDEYPANFRCEGLVGEKKGDKWGRAVIICSGHKAHSAATKTWAIPPGPTLLSGIIHFALSLDSPQALKRLRTALVAEMKYRTLRIWDTPHSPPEARKFRLQMLDLFAPAPRLHPRRRALLEECAASVLNGEWRQHDVLEHYCSGQGCCRDAEHTKQKIHYMLSRMLVVLPPCLFKKNNWLEWTKGLRAPGFLQGLHGLLGSAYLRAFHNIPREVREEAEQRDREAHADEGAPAVWPGDGHGGQDPEAAEAERMRKEKQKHTLRALQLFESQTWHDELVVLAQSLQPQLRLMSTIVSQRSDSEKIKQQTNWEEAGVRKYPAVSLTLGIALDEAMRDALRTFKTFEWPTCPDTEMNRSWLFRMTMRPAAVIYQLLRLRLSMFPYKLLTLLENRTLQTAQDILSVPPCLRDHLAKYVCNEFDTPEKLVSSDEAWHILHAIASMLDCTTFGVECLHSSNTRRSKSVTHTHRPHIAQVALHHVPWAGPTWMRTPSKKESAKRKGRPPKRKAVDGDVEPPPRRRRGGGGPWRAFVHYHVQVLQEVADFAVLGAKYRALSQADLEWYRELGHHGTQKGFPKKKKGPPKRHPPYKPCPMKPKVERQMHSPHFF